MAEEEEDKFVIDEENEKNENKRAAKVKSGVSLVGAAGPGHLSSDRKKRGSAFAATLKKPNSAATIGGIVGFDEEKEVHVPIPEVLVNPAHHRSRRASAVPMTSYVAVSAHAQVDPNGNNRSSAQPKMSIDGSTNRSSAIVGAVDKNRDSVISQAMGRQVASGSQHGVASTTGSMSHGDEPRVVSGRGIQGIIAGASPAEARPTSRRTSFFGGVITGMGRRASRAQSNLLNMDEQGTSPLLPRGSFLETVTAPSASSDQSTAASSAAAAAAARDPIWHEKRTIDGLPFYWNRRTKEVRFDKPDELKSDKEKGMETDDWTWVPHEKKVWQPAKIVKKQKSGETVCQIVKTGETIVVPANKNVKGKVIPLWPLKQSSLYIAEDDLVALDDPNEGLIMHTLRARYKQDQIYTFVGASRTVLISLNPYKQLDIYTLDEIDAQRNRGPNKAPPPHVFAIANDALETLRFNNQSAAILISGESGAGKTEATKQCLGFLAECAGSSNHVERKILLANPVLEAFGNAKTLRNNNSSRFGKWIEVRFDPISKEISGAQITPFLLERSRLIYQQKGERNYHVLYQLCASNKVRENHHLGDPTEFRYLNQSDCFELDGVDDEMELQRTIESMNELEFSQEEQSWIFKVVCGVLHLGNIDFVPKDKEKLEAQKQRDLNSGTRAAGSSAPPGRATTTPPKATTPEPVKATTPDSKKANDDDDVDLQKKPGCMIADSTRKTGKRYFAAKSFVAKAMPHLEAEVDAENKDASPKANGKPEEEDDMPIFAPSTKRKSHAPGTGKGSVEAAAECFGIPTKELVQVLCQRSITVRKEISVIPLSPEEARDGCDSLAMAVYGRLFSWIVERVNTSICSSINKGRFVGVLDIFGFEIFEKNSFEQLCINFTNEKLQQHFNSTMFKEEEGLYQFEGIRYAKVEFIDNQPVLDLVEGKPEGILLLLDDECKTPGGSDERLVSKIEKAQNKHPNFKSDARAKMQKLSGFEIQHYAGAVKYEARGFVAANTDTLYPDMYALCSRSADSLTRVIFPQLQENERLRLKTIGTHFRGQLTQLMDILKGTESRYIRCIKPNAKQRPDDFDSFLTLEQLRYSGVFDAVQIRKRGYPFRLTHRQFSCQFKCINEGYKYASHHDDFRALCEEIINASPQKFRGVQIGKTRVLYRAEHHKILMLLRNLAVEKILPWLQARFRSCLARMIYKRMVEAQSKLQDAMDAETDLDGLDDVINDVPSILGTLGEKVFPIVRPSNLMKAKALREGLQKWKEMEEELEKLDDDRRPPSEIYFEMVNALKKAEKLQGTPMTRFQERVLDSIKEKVLTCKLDKLEKEAADAIKAHNREEIARLIEANKGVSTPVISSLQEELRIMDEIEKDAVAAIENVDRDRMTKVVKKAAEFNISNANILRCAEMLALPEAKFVNMELEVAMKQHDERRRIHREIRLHELTLDESGSKYSPITSCPILRTPDSFASADLLSFLFGKQKLVHGMMKWQKADMPTSLVNFDTIPTQDGKPRPKDREKLLKKLAMISFRFIRAFMGDIKDELASRNPDEIAKQILAMAHTEPETLPEILLQTVKQLTDCPNKESRDKGFELLGVLCCVFVLPQELDFWINMWLRHALENDKNLLRKFNATIHRCRYGSNFQNYGSVMEIKRDFKTRMTSRYSLQPGKLSGPTSPEDQMIRHDLTDDDEGEN